MNAKTPVLLTVLGIALSSPALRAADEHGHDHGQAHGHKEATPHVETKETHTDEVKLTPEAIQRSGIKVAAVEKKSLVGSMTVSAQVAFNTEAMAHVGCAVKGRAAEIKCRVGDDVKKGDPLVVVESSELGEAQSDFLQKRTAVLVAASAVEPARGAVERARKLHEQSQGIALAEVQKREADLKAAEGVLRSAESAAIAAENKLHLLGMNQDAVTALAKSTEIDPKFIVRAPIDGKVIDREVTLGELVSPEKDAIIILADLRTLWVIANVPDSRLREAKLGAEARVKIAAVGDEAISGTISFISPALDARTRTAQVRIELANPEGKLRPGMFAAAEILSGVGKEAVLAVPAESVQTVEGEPSVFVPVAGEENTFARRAVTTGTPAGGMLPILTGLKEGDHIVVSGAFILKAELGKSEAGHEH